MRSVDANVGEGELTAKDPATALGASPHPEGVTFRLWAPHATRVAVVGSFNDWDGDRHPLCREADGCWAADVAVARVGDEYKFRLTTPQGDLLRIDPYARAVTSSVGNAIVHDTAFDWGGDDCRLPSWNELVIYELHVGTFHDRETTEDAGQFPSVGAQLAHLARLGVNAIQIMPVASFAGDRSWGYNPSHIFSVETSYGGPQALKRFVKRAHKAGLAVILDVVYNHFGPSDLDLWQFDGWSENGRGGIYFYNDDRAETPWGATRPDYRRPEVRRYLRDNVTMWFEEYHVDGLRFDSTHFMRSVRGIGAHDLPEGWRMLQEIHEHVAASFPGRITIAEDLQNSKWLTTSVGAGGAGFGAQWDPNFVHPVRMAVTTPEDADRSLDEVRDALSHCYDNNAFDRVIYSESHDEVANLRARVPQEISPDDPTGWNARKRSTLAAAMVLTAPGIPMLFQGQEFLAGGSFRDTVPVDWEQRDEFRGILELYRELIQLRLNRAGHTRGLIGHHIAVHHLHHASKSLAFHRWDQGGPGDDVIVVANLSRDIRSNHLIGFPAAGRWTLRFNSDWQGYNDDFENHPSTDVIAEPLPCDGMPCQAEITIGRYSVLIYSQ